MLRLCSLSNISRLLCISVALIARHSYRVCLTFGISLVEVWNLGNLKKITPRRYYFTLIRKNGTILKICVILMYF